VWICAILFYIIFHFDPSRIISKRNLVFLLLILFYLWSAITLFYTSNINHGINILETRLVILIVPALCILFNEKVKDRNTILKFFILGNIISILWCLLAYNLTSGWGPTELRIRYLSLAIKSFKHYNYLGLNLSVGLFLIAFLIRRNKLISQFIIFSTFAILFLLFIYITQSRMSLLVISISIVTIFIFIISQIKRMKFLLMGLIVALSLSCFFIMKNSPALKNLDNSKLSIQNIDKERAVLWANSIILIKENPIFGNGIGDSSIKQLEINKPKANSHNQILSFLLEGGIISVLLFFGSWVFIVFNFKKGKMKFYVLGILMTFFLFLLIESTFNRIANISLFVFILFVILKTEDKEKVNESLIVHNSIILLILPLILYLFYTYYKTFDKVELNPGIPETYATVPHKTVSYSKLPGKPLSDMPESIVGYKLDKTSFSNFSNGNAYSLTRIGEVELSSNDSLKVSVFCFVSEDFNGTWVRLSCESNTKFNFSSYYDLKQKGIWQKLSIQTPPMDVNAKLHLFFSKYNCENFADLEGSVIFAYPAFSIESKRN
jgi:O-antigen ligase